MAPKAAGRLAKTRSRSSAGTNGIAKKRPASVSDDSTRKKKCKSIISALSGVEELSPKVRQTLSGLVSQSLGLDDGLPPQYRHAAIAMLSEALASVEKKLEKELLELRSKVDGAQEDKTAREALAAETEAHLNHLKHVIIESKVAIKESSSSLATSRKSLKLMQAAERSSQGKLNETEENVERLHNVEKAAYLPLKEIAAQGRKGLEQLKSIQKLGKEFGFQETLLDSLPGVLKKNLDKRQTFDGLVVEQLEREFIKHYTKMEGKLKEEEEKIRERSQAVEEAQALVDESGFSCIESNRKLKEASAALSPSKKALTEARQHLRKFESDMQKLGRELSLAQARLDDFRAGPLTAFQELQKLVSDSIPETCEGEKPAVSSPTGDHDELHSDKKETVSSPQGGHDELLPDGTVTTSSLPDDQKNCQKEEKAAVPSPTGDASSSLGGLLEKQPSPHHERSASLATTCVWELSQTLR